MTWGRLATEEVEGLRLELALHVQQSKSFHCCLPKSSHFPLSSSWETDQNISSALYEIAILAHVSGKTNYINRFPIVTTAWYLAPNLIFLSQHSG